VSAWFDLFERSLRAEEKQQYRNIKGREFFFADFILHHLDNFEKKPEHAKIISRMQNIYTLYPLSSVAERRQALEESRRLIAGLRNPKEMREVVKAQVQAAAQQEASSDWRDVPVQFVKGVGPKLGALFAKVGVGTVGELLHYYPRQHLDYSRCTRISQLRVGDTATVWGYIHSVTYFNPPRKKQMTIVKLTIRDGTGRLVLSFYHQGKSQWIRAQMAQRYPEGAQIILSGTVKWDSYSQSLTLDKPEAEVMDDVEDFESLKNQDLVHLGRIVPVYPLTEGLNLKWVRKAIKYALDAFVRRIPEPLPENLARDLPLPGYAQALYEFHFPSSQENLSKARQRLVFQELFLTQLGLQYRRKQRELYEAGIVFEPAGTLSQAFLESLPFALTGAQNRVHQEILSDLQKTEPMSRLVQGDVGSGKTVVAILAMLQVVENEYQAAMMAPTEILAEQHYHKIFHWLLPLGVRAELLTGSQGARSRREALARLASGEAQIAIGTHALIQEGVVFRRLGLAIIDEQHRFGVKQRALLREKGMNPEILTMTATPIPRTLALTLYGDLDVSILDELPPGRKPVETQLVKGSQREKVWELMRRELEAGRQTYVVLPLVEESEKSDLKAATTEFEAYQELFPDQRVGLLHGQMKGADKDRVMRAFSAHELDILIATTVIEVGVDVPNASVMVIEHAERFGLAQLHQLRGRVGRGSDKAYCLLISDKLSDISRQRLQVFVSTTDGFVIAEEDLRLRGPGEFLGTRQSGLPDLVLTNLVEDGEWLELAREKAKELLSLDPQLNQQANQVLKRELYRFFRRHMSFLEA
jgi:ATP-dependent DNA helicase RecG